MAGFEDLVGFRRSQHPHEQGQGLRTSITNRLCSAEITPSSLGFQGTRNQLVTYEENSLNPDLAYLETFVSSWSGYNPG